MSASAGSPVDPANPLPDIHHGRATRDHPCGEGAPNPRTRDPMSDEAAAPGKDQPVASLESSRLADAAAGANPIVLRHTDWLYQRLTITGPTDDLGTFRAQAAGAGVVPWRLDYDRMEEDWFLRLIAGPPERRNLTVAGARILAGQLRAAVEHRREIAVSRVGQSRACVIDLHALIPVPAEVLALGPDDPIALAWLWQQWGTTQALRHVRELDNEQRASPDGCMSVGFFSADWTPWRAVSRLAERWTGLRFEVRPLYDPA